MSDFNIERINYAIYVNGEVVEQGECHAADALDRFTETIAAPAWKIGALHMEGGTWLGAYMADGKVHAEDWAEGTTGTYSDAGTLLLGTDVLGDARATINELAGV